ncbi:hypothetical protein VQH23_09960 [Pararoseomonas sp. SCSIO 73927]|uniref:hypothetical protein n=1 Tax=Pararoseomonas sp. SCSIO 73927 TaxID=3114537 RepID=UPI0030CDF5CB
MPAAAKVREPQAAKADSARIVPPKPAAKAALPPAKAPKGPAKESGKAVEKAPEKLKEKAPKPAKERTEPLNFRVTPEFRRAFKRAAAAQDCKKVELLERIFAEWSARNPAAAPAA